MPAHFETGFSVREVPWHGLGLVLDDYPGTWAEARRLAGLDWDPVEEPLYEVAQMYPDGRHEVKVVEDYKQIKRSDTGLRLTVASNTYEVIGHDVMGEILEAIMGQSNGQVRYETAGSLYEGRKVWALARLGDQRHLPGDPSPVQPYIALLNAHDGTAALRVIATSVRIVCANTWHAAEAESSKRGSAYAFRHTKNWRARVDEAKKALSTTHDEIERTLDAARAMLQVKVNKIQRDRFVNEFAIHRVLANTVGRTKYAKRTLQERLSSPRVKATLEKTVHDLYMIMESRTCDGIRDTMYGLVQAAGEFTDHFRPVDSDDSLFSRTVLATEPLKAAAVRIAGEVIKTG